MCVVFLAMPRCVLGQAPAFETGGPLASRDFPNEPKVRGGWGATKVTREALECLWAVGKLMVRERRGGEKVFDLTERVLPDDMRVESIDEHERVRRLLTTHLQSIGACEIGRLAGAYGPTGSPPDAMLSAKHVREMLGEGWIASVQIEGVEREYVCLAEDIPKLRRRRPTPAPRMTFLCPFDSLLWDRRGVAELWDFDYKLEAYTPAKKRQFGYYVMPILWGTRLVGRLDPKLDRDKGRLIVNGLWLEPRAKLGRQGEAQLAGTLAGFASFLGATKIQIRKTSPAALRSRLTRRL